MLLVRCKILKTLHYYRIVILKSKNLMNYNTKAKLKMQEWGGKPPLILAVETSCDETSVAITRGTEVISQVISSQIDIHRRFGGVVPEVASRNHTLAIGQVAEEALSRAKLGFKDIQAVAVTYGAGLLGALLVGVSYAKAAALALEVPLVGVSHIRGHIAANYIEHPDLKPPFICLVVSGGHTLLLHAKSRTDYVRLGGTADDAAGEAFDKVARVLGLPYPGGPEIDRLAAQGSPTIAMPNMYKDKKSLDFSYSGLKTAVINYVHTAKQRGEEVDKADLCASFQKAALDVLVQKSMAAVKRTGSKSLAASGGVCANSYLRSQLKNAAEQHGINLYVPSPVYCTDNAAMIGVEAYLQLSEGKGIAGLDLNADASLRLY